MTWELGWTVFFWMGVGVFSAVSVWVMIKGFGELPRLLDNDRSEV